MNYLFFRKSRLSELNSFVVDLSSPSNLSYLWNFGSLLGLVLLVQFVSGLLLTFHYAASITIAFDSVVHILRDVNGGWVLRFIHINGASFFFGFVYIHISRGLYYFSFKKSLVWLSGVLILLLLMMIAFMGYILPWGQMSFWGATVITNLLSSLPIWGEEIVFWIWGGFSVDNATLNRFFSFHFFFPFVLVFAVVLHLIFLHGEGSSNPLGIGSCYDSIFFYPYFLIKDFLGFFFFFFFFFVIIFFNPIVLVDSENFIMADSLVTPIHIQPEWYYLFSYAILRSVPNKLGGVLSLFFSILILGVLVLIESKFNSLKFYPFLELGYWGFLNVVIMLMWIGANQVEPPFYLLGQAFTFFFFFFFYYYFYFVKFWDLILS